MQNLILSLPKQEADKYGIVFGDVQEAMRSVSDETRIVFSVYDTEDSFEIMSEFPFDIAMYALAMSSFRAIYGAIKEVERFDAIVRQN